MPLTLWTCPVNCTLPWNDEIKVASYGDISGPGVVTGFVAVAWVVVLTLIVSYFLVSDAGDGETRHNIVDEVVLSSTRTLGRRVISQGNRLLPKPISSWLSIIFAQERIKRVLSSSLLALSDLQIFTGMAIIISGFASLCPSENEPNGLPAYHWQVLVHLAWFSTITQQAALLFNHQYFREHHWQRNCRLALILILLVFLVVAMVPTAFFNWYSRRFPVELTAPPDVPIFLITYYSLARSAALPSSPALCYFNISSASSLFHSSNPCRRSGGWDDFTLFEDMANSNASSSSILTGDSVYIPPSVSEEERGKIMHEIICDTDINLFETASFQAAVLGMASLVITTATNSSRFFGLPSKMWQKYIRAPVGHRSRQLIEFLSQSTSRVNPATSDKQDAADILVTTPLLSLHMTSRLILDLLASDLGKVLLITFSLTLGCIRLFPALDSVMHTVQSESWTFGQILAALAPLSPLALVVQAVLSGGSLAWHTVRNTQPSESAPAAFMDDTEQSIASHTIEMHGLNNDDPERSAPGSGTAPETSAARDQPAPGSTPSPVTAVLDSVECRSSYWVTSTVWLLVATLSFLAFTELLYIYLGWSSPKKLLMLFVVGFTTLPACCYVSILLGLSTVGRNAVGEGSTRPKIKLSRILVTVWAVLLTGSFAFALFQVRSYLKPVLRPSLRWVWWFMALGYLPTVLYYIVGVSRLAWTIKR